MTLLSGTTVSLPDGLLRLLFVTLYVAAAMAALGAIGLAISTMTEHAIGAIATVMILVVASEVVDNVPQLAAAGPYLPTHWWLSFDALLRCRSIPPPCSAGCCRSRSTRCSSAPSPGPASPRPTSPADARAPRPWPSLASLYVYCDQFAVTSKLG